MDQKKISLAKLVRVSLWISLTVVLGFFVKLKTPLVTFTPMCDAGIYLGATFWDARSGLAIGALSGGLLDVIYGEPIWIIPSMIIHGIQGLIVGYFTKGKHEAQQLLFPYVFGGLVMFVGYLIANAIIYGIMTVYVKIFTNSLQTVLGIMVALLLNVILKRFNKKI